MSVVDDIRREMLGLVAQAVVFVVGLVVSLVIGMQMSARTDGALSLLIVTILTGIGLIGAAVLSQLAHDHLVYGREQKP